jgi:putative hydrolase of the HAD superfamily
LKALVFDADGVVIVPPYGFMRYCQSDPVLSRADLGGFFRGEFVWCLRGQADLKAVLPAYLERWGWPGGVEAFLEVWFRAEHTLDYALLRRIQTLRWSGFSCYLATQQEAYRMAYLREAMGLAVAFDGTFASCELGHLKSEDDFYRKIEAEIGLEPQQIWFFDDAQGNIETARARGWRAYLYSGQADLEREIPHFAGRI